MCLPSDIRAHVLRSTLDTVADAIKGASLAPAVTAHLDELLADARRHAVELEETLRPVPVAAERATRRPARQSEPGSNVVHVLFG